MADTTTNIYNSQYVSALIRQTDLLTMEEKEKLMSSMGNFTEEERMLIGKQVERYEMRKKEILEDAERQKRRIDEEYLKQIKALYEQQERLIREEMKKRENADQSTSEAEASSLLKEI